MLACAGTAVAQSATELVQKNLAARGGAEKLAAIKTIAFTGKLVVGGEFELGYKEVRSRKGGAVRYDSTLQGMSQVQAWDGTTGWRLDPFQGRRDAEKMSADDARALADDGLIDGPLLASRSGGGTVTYLGREDFDGTDAYKLRVVRPDGAEYTYYLDPDTYLEIRVVETRTLRGAQQVTETEFGDYEQVDGVYFPFSIDQKSTTFGPFGGSKITIASAQANAPVVDSLFAMPSAGGSK